MNLHQIRYERNVLPLNYKPFKLVSNCDTCPINGKKGIRTLGTNIIRSLSRGVPSTTQPPFLESNIITQRIIKKLVAPPTSLDELIYYRLCSHHLTYLHHHLTQREFLSSTNPMQLNTSFTHFNRIVIIIQALKLLNNNFLPFSPINGMFSHTI